MDLKLTRPPGSFKSYGIFGFLSDMIDNLICVTLEHAYAGSNEPITFIPKLPPGVYTCVRGMHQLAGMNQPFETFEITGVPGHSGILFHVGNTNDDSECCVLLGTSVSGTMITFSRNAFNKFMALQAGVDSFALVVE
jgi:hypothetical protein